MIQEAHFDRRGLGRRDRPLWDEVAAATWIDPSLVTRAERRHLDVETTPGTAWGETLDLPAGAVVLALLPDGLPQAVRYGPAAWGVQFHPESVLTEHGHLMLANWLTQCGDESALAKSVGLSPVVGRSSYITELYLL